jgi:hypothetical protein
MALSFTLLAACTTGGSVDRNPDLAAAGESPWYTLDPCWLAAHQDEITARAAEFIHSRHPTVAAGFPAIRIRSVTLYDHHGSPVRPGEADAQFSILLQSLSDGILGRRTDVPVWEADVQVRSLANGHGALNRTVMLPGMIVCATSLFALCPQATGTEVVLEVRFTRPDGSTLDLAAGGTSSTVDAGGVRGSDKDKASAVAANATAAALAGVADALVASYETGR